MKLLHFLQTDCPAHMKEQLISLIRQEWPQAFDEDKPITWPDNPETHPTSFVLMDGDLVVSHVAVPYKYIEHEGETYNPFGLSEVMTHPSYRKQGLGLRLIKEAYLHIENNNPDISIYTCHPSLVPFYTKGGWKHHQHTMLVGGTRSKPFRSDSLGLATMIHLFSSKAKETRLSFEEADIYLDLGEKQLW
ncbi:GNAT family N-acetyltransferase [Priestia taiwanensis]|uniref:N-acetyltransferase domain-containing protein n=1 Tax=Priestia taiwanensis TaxID=1347902 RepID=A0A917AMH0_9BACI|nr:GNAT family N-acetyltransferase [Priestia taiwanensis]MBM7362339.1 GNAT superfamily N-acetyltransferase [Priestia taiwanensis]GGE61386.1 hypothetical protein GCM10007140_09620 [Priestia taiwanensis]